MRRLGAVIALAAIFVLTACAASGIAELDREQLDGDKLTLPARYFEDANFDPDSIRWLAEHEGVDFYAARSTAGTCVILVNDGDVDGSVAGCTGGGELAVSGVGFPSAHLYIDSAPTVATESMIELTRNLYVVERVSE